MRLPRGISTRPSETTLPSRTITSTIVRLSSRVVGVVVTVGMVVVDGSVTAGAVELVVDGVEVEVVEEVVVEGGSVIKVVSSGWVGASATTTVSGGDTPSVVATGDVEGATSCSVSAVHATTARSSNPHQPVAATRLVIDDNS